MKKGFWQVKLHLDSQMYTAMLLPSGSYVWTTLPMGLVGSSDEFQKKLDAVYNGKADVKAIMDDMIITDKSEFQKKLDPVYNGKADVKAIMDDMIITDKSEEEHDHNFPKFLQITRSNSLRLNEEKLQSSLNSRRYCSLDTGGLGMDWVQIQRRLSQYSRCRCHRTRKP